jgi:hypothetical protein
MVNSAMAFGTMKAPPIPVSARIVQWAMKFVTNPLTRLNMIHQAPPTTTRFLCPYTAPKRPPIKTKAPCVNLCEVQLTIQCASDRHELTGMLPQFMQTSVERLPLPCL